MHTDALSILCSTCRNATPLATCSAENPVGCGSCGHTYSWDEGILLLDCADDRSDHPDEALPLLADVESRHFWFNGRNKLILSTMREFIGTLESGWVLDIGCGTGFLLAALQRAGMNVLGLDMHLDALRYARKRTKGLLLWGTVTRVPFTAQFDVVMLCDVY